MCQSYWYFHKLTQVTVQDATFYHNVQVWYNPAKEKSWSVGVTLDYYHWSCKLGEKLEVEQLFG